MLSGLIGVFSGLPAAVLQKILFSSENMQSAMEKFEKSGAWNLPIVENNTYLGFVSKAKIFTTYRKKLQRRKEE